MFLVCRYCGGKIIVPSVIVHQTEVEREQTNNNLVTQQREQRLYEVQNSLNAGRKIEAISMFREYFGTDLATAKTAVERLESGDRMAVQKVKVVAPVRRIEERIHGGLEGNKATAKGASFIFWLVVILGFLIATYVFQSS